MTHGVLCAGAVLLTALSIAAQQQDRHPVLAASAKPAATAPARLADTGLYMDGELRGPVHPRNRTFAPQYPLWSDGLRKQRWVHLPAGTRVDTTDEYAWDYPVGTKFWKEFSLGERPVETRFLWRATPDEWVFATYVWSENGTEATLAPEAGVRNVAEVGSGRRHNIPSRTDCVACHGTGRSAPLGFNALQLSTDRDPHAIHAEPLQPEMLTLQTLEEEGLLFPSRPEYVATPPRIHASAPSTRAVLGYLASNCGVCHNGTGEVAAFSASLAYRDVVTDPDAVVRGLVDRPSRWQVPGLPDGASVLVRPGVPEESAVLVRMRSRSPSSQMPALGTVVRDEVAVAAMTRWIAVDLVPAH